MAQICKRCGIPKMDFMTGFDQYTRKVWRCPICSRVRDIEGGMRREREAFNAQIATLKEQIKNETARFNEERQRTNEAIATVKRMTLVERQDYYNKEVQRRAESRERFQREQQDKKN